MELKELNKEEYENFVKTNKYKSHFLQSYIWGQFSKEKKNLNPYYVGLVDNGEIRGTALLLQKKLPLGYSYFYSPRGFVIDFSDKDLLDIFTKEIIKFIKKKRCVFLKIDPDIIRNKYNYLDEEVLTSNSNEIFNNIISCGFKHLGFTKNFETMQPRYTFRIDLNQDINEIVDHFSKTTKQRIKKAQKLDCKVTIGDSNDIETFYHLMTLTEDRKDFVSYTKDYYEKQYEMLSKEDMATLFLGRINTKEVINNLNDDLRRTIMEIDGIDKDNLSKSKKNKLNELIKTKENLTNEIAKYKKYNEEYGDEVILNAHMIINYGNKAWVLYAGNHNILTESYANYLTYYEHIKYFKEKGIEIYDQFGTIGDLSKDNPRLGLHEFKKKFGGDYVEFLGEFDYVTNKFMYFVFTKLVPLYRKIIRNKSRRKISNEVNRDK